MARAAHRPSRRGEILEAAIRVFGRWGHAATLAQITAATGMATAAVYYHFESKDALFTEAVAAVAERHLDLTRSREDVPEAHFTMGDAVELVWNWAEDHPLEARLLYMWSAEGPDAARRVRDEFVATYTKRALRRIERTRQPATTDELLSDTLAAHTYLALTMAVSEEWASGRYPFPDAGKGAVVDMLIDLSRQLTSTP